MPTLLRPRVACRAPPSIGFPRQEYWSGLPFPSPGKLPNPGIEPTSPALAGEFFTTEPPTCLFLKAPSRVPEKHLFLLYWLCQSLWLCRSQQTWNILKEMGIPDHLTCLLRNLYAGQEAQLELDMKQQTGSKPGKEYVKAVYCHPAYLTYMQSTSWETLDWKKHSWNQDCREKYQ